MRACFHARVRQFPFFAFTPSPTFFIFHWISRLSVKTLMNLSSPSLHAPHSIARTSMKWTETAPYAKKYDQPRVPTDCSERILTR